MGRVLEIATTATLWFGVALMVITAVVVMCVRNPLISMHFLAPITSLAAPTIGLAAVLDLGWQISSTLVAVTVLLLGISGPACSAAIARFLAQEDGLVPPNSPD